jgi:NAD(P)-dependent dehydrogenase (short-subunit alcohol dehydrogenase family)
MSAEQRVALVTGASRGIGRASAVALAQAGFDVAIAARTVHEGDGRDDSDRGAQRSLPGSLETTATAIEACGSKALPVAMDLLDRASLRAAVSHVEERWGRIDVLVNNAVHTGAGSMEHFIDLDIETIQTKLEANVIAQILLIKHVLPGMLERGKGTIINMTSAVATSDPPAPAGQGGWGLGYAMTKGAFHRVAGILAVELTSRGILAFNVEPGFVITERMAVNQGELGFEGRYRGAPPSVPAAVVTWLAAGISPAQATELNGSTIRAQKTALEHGLHVDWRGG